jgi:hypothetical protein
MDYTHKYLKYKSKYLELKELADSYNSEGGNGFATIAARRRTNNSRRRARSRSTSSLSSNSSDSSNLSDIKEKCKNDGKAEDECKKDNVVKYYDELIKYENMVKKEEAKYNRELEEYNYNMTKYNEYIKNKETYDIERKKYKECKAQNKYSYFLRCSKPKKIPLVYKPIEPIKRTQEEYNKYKPIYNQEDTLVESSKSVDKTQPVVNTPLSESSKSVDKTQPVVNTPLSESSKSADKTQLSESSKSVVKSQGGGRLIDTSNDSIQFSESFYRK